MAIVDVCRMTASVVLVLMSCQCVEEIKPWIVHVVRPLQSFVHKGVVLLGDSVSVKVQ